KNVQLEQDCNGKHQPRNENRPLDLLSQAQSLWQRRCRQGHRCRRRRRLRQPTRRQSHHAKPLKRDCRMSIPDILQQIVETKKHEVAAAKAKTPESNLRTQIASTESPRNFFAALTKEPEGYVNIIAEVKKASPSAGVMKADFDPVATAKLYHA